MNKRLLFQSKERYFIFMFLFPLAAYMDVRGAQCIVKYRKLHFRID